MDGRADGELSMVFISAPAGSAVPQPVERVVCRTDGDELRLMHALDAFEARRIAAEWSRGYFGANPGRVIVFTRGTE